MFNRIYFVLKQLNIRQEALATKLGVSRAKVSRWCNNIQQPSWQTLYLISNLLEVNIEKLIYAIPHVFPISEKELNLSKLGTPDAFLKLVTGESDLNNLEVAFLRFTTDYGNGTKESYPISLLSYVTQMQNPKIPVVEVGEIIDHCNLTKVKIENCQEKLKLVFLCPKEY
ncbi:MAG: helix-turn-helix transcriptional regulator [Cytophagales bacterium]|nr:helix-turn-helix transcriptional regulator [Cytophagales bacterium]